MLLLLPLSPPPQIFRDEDLLGPTNLAWGGPGMHNLPPGPILGTKVAVSEVAQGPHGLGCSHG